MSLFQWEHQLFCYDWLFYKCFSVPFCRNVLTRSGYWLLITQLNCLYCTTDFLALTWPESFSTAEWDFLLCGREMKRCELFFKTYCWEVSTPVTDSSNTLCVRKPPCKYHVSWIIVYYCKYTGSLLRELAAEIWKSAAPLAELFYCWVYLTHLWILKWINVRCEHL